MALSNCENLTPGTNAINACLGRRYWPDTDECMDADSIVAAVRAYFRREIDASSERTRSERAALCVILPALWVLLFLLLRWMGSATFATQLTMLSFGIMVTLVCCRDPYAARRAGASEILERLEDPTLIGVVAGYLGCGDMRVQGAALEALGRTLPLARPEHSRFIHADEMTQLIRVATRVRPNFHAGLPIQTLALYALRYIGSAEAFAPVQSLMRDADALPHSVAAAACECLPYLEQRAREAHQTQTLLRPAREPDNPDTLLRPGQGSAAQLANQEVTQLLRAS